MKNKLFIEIFENVSDGVYVLDRDRKILFWNRKAEEMTGYTKSDVIGKRCQDNILKHIDEKGNELCLGSCPLVKAMEEKEVKEAKVFLHHKEGYRVPVFVIGIPVFDEKGEVIGAVEIFRENFKERDFEEEIRKLRELAFIDELTKVLNRRGLEYYLRMKLREAKRRKRTIGVLFVDVDDFKRINDDFGHVVGDEVLRFVAMTIRKNIRMGDVVARYGGDEFVVIVDLDEEKGLKVVAEKLKTLISNSYVTKEDKEVRVTVSIGGTVVGERERPEEILKRADELMYESKRKGGNACTIS